MCWVLQFRLIKKHYCLEEYVKNMKREIDILLLCFTLKMCIFFRDASAKTFNLFKKGFTLYRRFYTPVKWSASAIEVQRFLFRSRTQLRPIKLCRLPETTQTILRSWGRIRTPWIGIEAIAEEHAKIHFIALLPLNGPFRFCEIRSHQIWIPIYKGSSNAK